MKKTLLLITCVAVVLPFANATRLLVPQQYSTIQAAINAASANDTVLVSPGTFYENINFRAKGIVLASTYIFTNDTTTIDATVINGSQPSIPDSASCVIIASKLSATSLDTTAMIIGFKITGGTGTKWEDEHNPGSFYREGGGILVQYLSPRILHNHITNNYANDLSGGMSSAGGGAIRCGDSNPLIQNNVIDNNQGRYGAGIVFNFCGGVIRNNLIVHNTGGQNYGGSGIWMYEVNAQGSPRTIINNTIIYNYSVGPGGGIRAWSSPATIKNNILWGNTASAGNQIYNAGSSITVTYNDIQGGYAGAGNISNEPQFDVLDYFLSAISPCIDKGDSTTFYNDIPDTSNPSSAKFPAKGGLRNDMGAYGGPWGNLLSGLNTLFTGIGAPTNLISEPEIRIIPNPVKEEACIIMHGITYNELSTELFDMCGRHVLHFSTNSLAKGDYSIRFLKGNLSPGNYWFILFSNQKIVARKSLVID